MKETTRYKSYTVEEIAELTGVTPWTVREWLKNGSIVGFKLGRRWRVTEESLRNFLNVRYHQDEE